MREEEEFLLVVSFTSEGDETGGLGLEREGEERW